MLGCRLLPSGAGRLFTPADSPAPKHFQVYIVNFQSRRFFAISKGCVALFIQLAEVRVSSFVKKREERKKKRREHGKA